MSINIAIARIIIDWTHHKTEFKRHTKFLAQLSCLHASIAYLDITLVQLFKINLTMRNDSYELETSYLYKNRLQFLRMRYIKLLNEVEVIERQNDNISTKTTSMSLCDRQARNKLLNIDDDKKQKSRDILQH